MLVKNFEIPILLSVLLVHFS